MTRYIILTDTHFGHEKIKIYTGRPDNYEEQICSNLKRFVQQYDIIVHLGDVSFGKDGWLKWRGLIEECKLKTNNKLTTILTKGNHDKRSHFWYIKNGFNMVTEQNIHGHFHNAPENRHETYLIKNDKQRLLALESNNYEPCLLNKLV